MDIQDFIYLTAIDKYGNLTRAAAALYITQSALSQAVKNMERELGFTLVERKKSPAVFTDRGAVVLADAKGIVNEYYLMQKKWQAMADWQCGHLTVGISQTYNRFYMAKLLPVFLAENPHLQISVIEDTSDNLEEMLQRGELDLSIFSLPLTDRRLEYQVLFEEDILFAFPAGLGSNSENTSRSGSTGSPRSINKLMIASNQQKEEGCDLTRFRDEPFIMIKEGQRLNRICRDILASYQIEPQISFETKSVETVNPFVAQGLGCGFIPAPLAAAAPLPQVVYCPLTHPLARRSFVAAYPREDLLSVWGKRFINLAKGKS